MIVRSATATDVPALTALGLAMWTESTTAFPPIEPERIEKQLALTMAHPQSFLAALAEDNGEAVGMVTAVAGDYAFSTERRASCDMLFVLPERRGVIAAKLLVRHFEDWAKSIGAKTAIMGISTGVHPARTGELFKRLGYDVMGITYRKAI